MVYICKQLNTCVFALADSFMFSVWFLTALATGFRIYDCYKLVKYILDEPDVGVEKIGDKIQGIILSKISEPSLRRLTQIVLDPIRKELIGTIKGAMGVSSIRSFPAIPSGFPSTGPYNATSTVPAVQL